MKNFDTKKKKTAKLAFPAIVFGLVLLAGPAGWAGSSFGGGQDSLIVRSLKEQGASQHRGHNNGGGRPANRPEASRPHNTQKPRNNPPQANNNRHNNRPQAQNNSRHHNPPPGQQAHYRPGKPAHRRPYYLHRPAYRHSRPYPAYRAHHRPHYKKMPRGYLSIHFGGIPYFYYSGLFYRHGSSGYFMVSAPIGAIVYSLPVGYRTVVVDRSTYYCYNDVYYQRVPSGYRVIEAPVEVAPATPVAFDRGDWVEVNVPSLNVRTGPGREFAVKNVLSQYTQLEVMGGATGGWVYVRLSDEDFGWVGTAYVDYLNTYPQG